MNDSVTLNNTQAIQANIPKFPKARPWTFNQSINNILPNSSNPDTSFNPSGMLGKGREPQQYGIADLSQELPAGKPGSVVISNDEYMSRQTGIPRHMYEKFRRHTNNSRASLPYDTQFLAPQPNAINIQTTKDTDGESISITPDRRGSYKPYVQVNNGQEFLGANDSNTDIPATLQYNGYIKYPIIKKEPSNNGSGVIHIIQRSKPLAIQGAWDRYIKKSDNDPSAFYDTMKHEVSHQNTARNINDILTYVPNARQVIEWYNDIQRNHPLLMSGSPRITPDVRRDLNIENMYDLFSPKDAFIGGSYFNEPGEAWGAANRVKNDGAGLFYKKHGRLPGFDDFGDPITGDQKIQDIQEAIRLFHNENPGRYTKEGIRINNLETDPNDMMEWMLSTPYENYGVDEAPPGLTMWDLAYNDNGRMNKKASANLLGLCKAASQVKEAGKIMAVKVTKMDTHLGRLKMRAHYVYMPDCAAYRDIITNGSPEKKAALANKFWLNQTPACVLVGCELEVVDKS